MRPERGHNAHIQGVKRDILLIVLIFAGLYFIDVKVAAFIAVVCTAVLLIRRIILDYNPGFVTGHHIQVNGVKVSVPKGIDVFTLSKSQSIKILNRYIEVISSIVAPLKF